VDAFRVSLERLDGDLSLAVGEEVIDRAFRRAARGDDLVDARARESSPGA
jgi:hypothetical protein